MSVRTVTSIQEAQQVQKNSKCVFGPVDTILRLTLTMLMEMLLNNKEIDRNIIFYFFNCFNHQTLQKLNTCKQEENKITTYNARQADHFSQLQHDNLRTSPSDYKTISLHIN